MNFKKCYEDSYKDHRNELSETDKAFFAGFKYAYDQLETFMTNADVYESVPESVSPTLARVVSEVKEGTVNDVRDWLRMEWFELLVSLLDDCEDGQKRKNSDYGLPEPLSEERVTGED